MNLVLSVELKILIFFGSHWSLPIKLSLFAGQEKDQSVEVEKSHRYQKSYQNFNSHRLPAYYSFINLNDILFSNYYELLSYYNEIGTLSKHGPSEAFCQCQALNRFNLYNYSFFLSGLGLKHNWSVISLPAVP